MVFFVPIIRVVLCGIAVLTSAAASERRVVAYVPNWIDLAAFAPTIDYAKVTHLNVAFENPTNAEGDVSFCKGNALLIEQAHAHGVKVLVSIGGGAASSDKKLQALTFDLIGEPKRAGFVAKLVAYVQAHGFDGLDVDLEGPSINKDYGALIRDLSAVMRPRGLLLTAALSKGYGGANVPDSAIGHFDFVNIMAYDATGPWNPKEPGQHSSLAFAKENAAYWLGRGLPKAKAVLGVPFYGYGFGTAFKKRDYPYARLVAEFPNAEKVDQLGDTIWYNGIPTIRAKASYVVEENLGGVMIWSLDYDAKGAHSLLSTIHEVLSAKE